MKIFDLFSGCGGFRLAGNSVMVNVVNEIMKAIKFVDFMEY